MTGRKTAAGAGAWLEQARGRIKAVDGEAQKRVRLLVAGPRREAFVDALRGAGPIQDGSIVALDSLAGQQSILDGVRAGVYCPDAEATNGALSATAAIPIPILVLRTGEASGPEETRLATTTASSKPIRGAPSIYYLSEMSLGELRKHVLPDVVHLYRGAEVALAAAIPAFRTIVAARLTMDCAMNSLKIAAVSAVADHIPVLGLITGGIASAGDTIAITGLQMHMLLRMAAAYGKKPELARIFELIPVIGGGYGWRALARELSGFIPVAGIPIKAAIAYAGTLVVGQAAAHYYETGLAMSPNAVSALYREASERAKDFAHRFAPKTRGDRPRG